MDDALGDWLALREAADTAARSKNLTQIISAAIPVDLPVHVLDLATGTGANLRYLVERLPTRQRWLVVDRSAVLLARLLARTALWGATRGYEVRPSAKGCVIRGDRLECEIETRQLDLRALDVPEIFSGRHLVTASALLDLVSEQWLRTLAAYCRAARSLVLFAITYDGRSSCTPGEPEDEMVLVLFNRHQRMDKGLGGAAAGPDAAGCAGRIFGEAGYWVEREPSDWVLGPDERKLQRGLIDGWAKAAQEIASDAAPAIAEWRLRRLAHVDAGRSHLIVGHQDLAATLRS